MKIQVPILPLRDVIVFPHMVVPLFVGREKSIHALEECVQKKIDLFLVAQRNPSTVMPSEEDLFHVGTLGTILQILRLPDNTVKVLVEGRQRARIDSYVDSERMLEAVVEELVDTSVGFVEQEALTRSLRSEFEVYVKLNKRLSPEILMGLGSLQNTGHLVDVLAAHVGLKLDERQELLEIAAMDTRMERLLHFLQREIEILHVEKKIRTRVKKQMERSQKEYYLNEQMQAIQKELGEKDEFKAEIQQIEKQARNKAIPQEARARILREVRKLKMMPPMSAEATVVRNYIDWLVALPWNSPSTDCMDLVQAKAVLEEDHYGLEDVKERIVEYLAVRMLLGKSRGQVLCFVGPPGVGKTSLAKSIARALQKKFVRCSLGGVRDEAEIRGHRRTYVGAMPGKVIQSMKKAGSSNPVFLLDEVDKMSTDFRGDPSAALLEVLDPEQNESFVDHYLEVDYDISGVMFLLTANSLHGIPRPLLDRMEVVTVSGYMESEKFHIVKKYLLAKQMGLHGLTSAHVEITDDAILQLIRFYTQEAGVRHLERHVAHLCRKVARSIVENNQSQTQIIKADDLVILLGPPKVQPHLLEAQHAVGLTNGLAYTESGGDVLHIEVTVLPGKGQVKVTGKLGEVMQESAATAMSYVRSRATLLGLEKNFYQNCDIHLHVPEGAVPKDGPSAGIAMATAITSALTGIPVRRDIAMTGEITLRGRVLPIGGLKEKLLAAKACCMRAVIIPHANLPDLTKIPAGVLEGVEIISAQHADEVLRHALVLSDPELFLVAAPAPVSLIVSMQEKALSTPH